MTSVGGEDEEYESDPEQAKLSLTMRRREASDDEDDQEEEVEVLPPGLRTSARGVDSSRVSDCDSDGQGATADYDDEDSDYYEEEEEEEVDEEDYYEVSGRGHAEGKGLAHVGTEVNSNNNNEGQVEEDAISRGDDKLGGVTTEGAIEYCNVEEDEEQFEDNASCGKVQEVKKENEPFAVPTAGTFYMHEDRLRDSAGGGGRRHGYFH